MKLICELIEYSNGKKEYLARVPPGKEWTMGEMMEAERQAAVLNRQLRAEEERQRNKNEAQR